MPFDGSSYGLKSTPYNFQKKAERLFSKRRQLALFMEPGTGKTLTAIALVLSKLKSGRILVICPKNIIGSWEDQLDEHLNGFEFTDDFKDYDFVWKNSKYPWHFFVINFESARINIHKLLEGDWNFIIIDESHRIKNRRAKVSKALWRLKAKYKIIMSGTPIPKDEIDLWSQFKFLNDRIWGSNFDAFANAALKEIDRGDYWFYVPHKKKIKRFMKRASEYCYYVKADDVIELPGQRDIPVYLELKGKHKKCYDELASSFMTHYEGMRATIGLSVTGLTRLHQLAGGHLTLENNDVVRFKEQPKLFWLLDKIEDLGNEKLIVICKYTLEIELIAAALKKKKIGYEVMKGKMKVSETNEVRRRFIKNSKSQVLIGQVQTVKEGNNFQHCRYMVFYSKSLSYIDIEQCKKRIYRNGQKKKVAYWHLIMKNTIDEDYETIVDLKYRNAEQALIQLTTKRRSKPQWLKQKKKRSPRKHRLKQRNPSGALIGSRKSSMSMHALSA